MPYALYKDGTRISNWYPSRIHVEAVAVELNTLSRVNGDATSLTLAPGYDIKLSTLQSADLDELALAKALDAAGLSYVHKSQDSYATLGLDFKAADIFFELMQFHSPSSLEQCARAPNVLMVQGSKACAFLIDLLHAKAELETLRARLGESCQPMSSAHA